MSLELGVIGISEGNGHPYSWAAIFNGYDPAAMKNCGFPVISEYLAKQRWPEARIKGAKVTCVWTQDEAISHKIAAASLIENVVQAPQDMIGRVDGVLLARDDAERHYEIAAPFIDAGIPVYIDKPIALSVNEMKRIYAHEKYPGQIFSCSALRYAPELMLSDGERHRLGPIRQIHAFTPKSWDKYAIHIIDPVLNILDESDRVRKVIWRTKHATAAAVSVLWSSGIITNLHAVGDKASSPITIRLLGSDGWKDLFFEDSFRCFKAALEDFMLGIETRSERSRRKFNETAIALLELGRRD